MAYSLKADILNAKGSNIVSELSDNDDNIITASIEWADGEIDSYVGERYTVPLSSPPQLIENLSVQLAICRLYGRRHTVPTDIQKKCENAYERLKKIANGEIQLSGCTEKSEVSTIQPFESDDYGEWEDPKMDMNTLEDKAGSSEND